MVLPSLTFLSFLLRLFERLHTTFFHCLLQNLYTVSFSKPGYVELSGVLLSVGTEISLSFSTLEDTGTILLGVGGASPVEQQVCVQ